MLELKDLKASEVLTGTPQAVPQGEVNPVVRNIIKTLPGIPLTQVTAILNGEFLPENLHKLPRSYDQTHDDVESTI
jgi:hypothetical protein